MLTSQTKVTLATIKSFIRKNRSSLFISCKSSFDGMTDCVESCPNPEFVPAQDCDYTKYTLGIKGAWFVGGSRNYFKIFETNELTGYTINNCCGSFVLAVYKASITKGV